MIITLIEFNNLEIPVLPKTFKKPLSTLVFNKPLNLRVGLIIRLFNNWS